MSPVLLVVPIIHNASKRFIHFCGGFVGRKITTEKADVPDEKEIFGAGDGDRTRLGRHKPAIPHLAGQTVQPCPAVWRDWEADIRSI